MSPADEAELKLASILYYRAYEKELPLLDYRKQDIQYIIRSLKVTIRTGENRLESETVH